MDDRPMTTMSTTDVIELLLAAITRRPGLSWADSNRSRQLSGPVTSTKWPPRSCATRSLKSTSCIPSSAMPPRAASRRRTARIAEQSETEKLLAAMEKLDSTSEEFEIQFTTLRQAVLDHASAEEASTFPLLKEMEDDESRRALGGRYEHAKAKAPAHPHPHAPHTPPASVVFERGGLALRPGPRRREGCLTPPGRSARRGNVAGASSARSLSERQVR